MRRGVPLVACGLAIATLTACGARGAGEASTVSTSHLSTSPQPSTTTTPAGPTRCTAAMLRGTVRMGDAAAGNRYATLVVTNTATHACTLYGHGGLQLIDASGKPNPTNQIRKPDPPPSLVTLQPGQSAAKQLHWVVVATGDEPDTGPCQPPSAGLKVIPPDETEQFTVLHDFGPVCDKGHIDDGAYTKA